MPATLRTVTGPLAVTAVTGPVLPHEHLVLDLDRTGEGAAVLDAERHAPAVVMELSHLREVYGLSLVADLTCRGMGRDTAALARISRASGVPVIAGTGWYYEPYHPPEIAASDVEHLTETLIAEITHGIPDASGPPPRPDIPDIPDASGVSPRPGTTGTSAPVRPGVIGEIGTGGERPTEPETRVLRAAARAALATGLSVATHARLGRGGLAQLDVLTGEGLPPDRISIGHQDLLDDPATHRILAASGAYVAFDTIGKETYHPDTTRLRLLLALLNAGHANRALLSCDISRHAYLRAAGGRGYGHLFTGFLPALRAAGADEDLIALLTRRNALRFLTAGATT
ncbi:phosphotriesterase family protein [Streptomyces qinzhouensis]|uniref:Phosphotriesterase n=1 Tax=Streptomyces qinzhouensis TaxID=2599401 RepID=A0A5B8IIW1_9ACTN|nr:phosphotriesterase [Streptomyces qinzhouensis]QDY78382.1 phosphotriesterase [Streptomyces qinzhouensis]